MLTPIFRLPRIDFRLVGLAALAAGVVLRITGLLTSSIWYDEAFSLALTRQDPLNLVRLASQDFNPPLWELVLWPFVHTFGFSEFGLRLPALLAGLVALWLAYRLAVAELELTPAEQAAGLVLVALLPGLIWTSQDGRTYAMFSALYLGALWFALRQRPLGLFACCGLMAYAHNAGLFYALPAVFLYGIRGAGWKRANLTWLAICAMMIPWAASYLSSSNTAYWLGPLTGTKILQSLSAAWFMILPSTAWYLAAAVLIVICLVVAMLFAVASIAAAGDTRWQSTNAVLLVAAIGPLVLLLVYSLAKQNVIFYRPLLPLVIPMALFLAHNLTPRRLTWVTWITPYSLAMVLIAALLVWSPTVRGSDLRQQADMIRAAWQPGDVIYHATGTSLLPMREYLPEMATYLLDEIQSPALLQAKLADAFGIQRAGLETIPHGRVWIVWSRDPVMTPAAQTRMARYTQSAHLVGRVTYLQAATIEIYLLEK